METPAINARKRVKQQVLLSLLCENDSVELRTANDAQRYSFPHLRNHEPARTELPGTKPNLQSRLYCESRETQGAQQENFGTRICADGR